jgi:hypothetical protein
MPFEYDWWKSRGWLRARSFRDLDRIEASPKFDARERLLLLDSLQAERSKP